MDLLKQQINKLTLYRKCDNLTMPFMKANITYFQISIAIALVKFELMSSGTDVIFVYILETFVFYKYEDI